MSLTPICFASAYIALWIGTEKAFAAQPSANAIVYCLGALPTCGVYVAGGFPGATLYRPVALSYLQSLTCDGRSAPLMPPFGDGVNGVPVVLAPEEATTLATATTVRAVTTTRRRMCSTDPPPGRPSR